MTATFMRTTATHRLCPACGELLVSSRCPECAPIEPARPYSERITQPVNAANGAAGAGSLAVANAVDVRRATSEWVTGPEDRDPQTRRAHPTLVRTALAEAEERARDTMSRSALVTHVESTTRPRFGSTASRLRRVTPLPPSPSESSEAAAEESVIAAASIAPAIVADLPSIQAFEPPANEPQAVSPVPLAAASPRTPDQYLPTPQPFFETSEPEPENRRATLFWLTLFGGAAILLVLAAI